MTFLNGLHDSEKICLILYYLRKLSYIIMADNYLERKMEEHTRGQRRVASRSTALQRPGTAVLPLPMLHVLIECEDVTRPDVTATIRAFTAAGCKVAFRCDNASSGARAAQALSARALPLTPEAAVDNLLKAWGAVEVIINFLPETSAAETMALRAGTGLRRLINVGKIPIVTRLPPSCTSNAVCPDGNIPANILYLSLPQSSALNGICL